MIPVVALVGRENVGKSTLFNHLTRTRKALVANFSGLTRDRQYGRATFERNEFIVIDTGGVFDVTITKGVEKFTYNQALLAIAEADIVLFIVDGCDGILPADQEIAQYLRNKQKVTFLLVNKTDCIDSESVITDFYSLGLGEIYAISAAHGRGITKLLERVIEQFRAVTYPIVLRDKKLNLSDQWSAYQEKNDMITLGNNNYNLQDFPIKLAIVGRPNVGKSTLINRILGEERMIVYDEPGTTRDSIYIPIIRNERKYILIDTAGVRKRRKVTETIEKFSVIKTLKSIEDSNVVLLVIDAKDGISDQDLSLLGFILNSSRSLVIVINKWDILQAEERDRVKNELDLRLNFINFARIHFISALNGIGISNLFKSIHEAYESSNKHTSTSLLTRIMQMAAEEYPPARVQGRRVKLKYAHSGGYNPPIIVIHGNQVSGLKDSYKRYLINYFRRSLKIIGTPICLQFKEGVNPFSGKRNILNPSQIRKRRRIILHLKKKN